MSSFYKKLFTFSSGIVATVSIVYCLREFYQGKRYEGKERLTGRTVIVTGANSGIGFETAKEMAKRGAGKVILACRDTVRCQAARRKIIKTTHNRHVVCRDLDLRSFDSIVKFCEDVRKSEPKIDILVNNAGVMRLPHRRETADGLEIQMGVNHFGHFLLTNLLLDHLETSDYNPARVINVSSVSHKEVADVEKDIEDLKFTQEPYNTIEAYNMSKLSNILFTRGLADKLQKDGKSQRVHVYAVYPGWASTEITRYMPHELSMISSTLLSPLRLFARTARIGSQVILHCALDPDAANDTGKYYFDCHEELPSADAMRDDLAKRLWTISVNMTRLHEFQRKLDISPSISTDASMHSVATAAV